MPKVEDPISLPLADDLIEIRDPEIDTQAILLRVQERLRQRRQNSSKAGRQFPVYSGAGMPQQRDLEGIDPNLYYHLDLVNQSYFDFETGADVRLSPATRGRVLGRLWSLIRQQAHQLVLFYVNRNIEQQVAINRQLVSVLNLLTETVQDQQREIMALRSQVDEMRDEPGDA